MDVNPITETIIGAALHVHTHLGPGLYESVYHRVLGRELQTQGLFVESKKRIPVIYNGYVFEEGFEADLVVARSVVVEIKSIKAITELCEKQLLTYLRILDYRVGLIINFNTVHLKDGIKRMVNKF